jgi:hypothetical protein
MRLFQAAAAIAFIAIAVAILGGTVINAKPSKQAVAVPASTAIDVMRMMIDAKDLPIQQFDAH